MRSNGCWIDDVPAPYDTLAGLVLEQLGHIPTVGETVQWADWHFEVVDMDGLRIDKLLVHHAADASNPPHAPEGTS